jgi:hypothetical protein
VATPAQASPGTVVGTSTSVSVLGADAEGEAGLVYAWSAIGTPPAAVTFAPNGSNASKVTTATFSKAGAYTLQAAIRDGAGQVATSAVDVMVVQTPTSAIVAPASVTLAPGGAQAFTATGRDQFAAPLATQPVFTWTASGGGTISGAGLYTAGTVAGGPFTVSATGTPGPSGTAQVTIGAAATTVTLAPAADAFVRDGDAGTNFGAQSTLVVKSSIDAGNSRVVYLRFALTGVGANVSAAKLRLFGSRPAAAVRTDAAFAVASTSWGEATLTWSNRPPVGAKQSPGVTVGTAAQYYEWDLSAYVRAQKQAGATALSLALQAESGFNEAPDTFSARESASNRPQLVITSAP